MSHLQIQDERPGLRTDLLWAVARNIDSGMETETVLACALTELTTGLDALGGIAEIVLSTGRRRFVVYQPIPGITLLDEPELDKTDAQLLPLITWLDTPVRISSPACATTEFIWSPMLVEAAYAGSIGIVFENCTVEARETILESADLLCLYLRRHLAVEKKICEEKFNLLASMLSTNIHDMKNPLAGISGYTQLIKLKTNDNGIKDYCKVIIKTIDRLSYLNVDLLNFLRGQPLELNRENFSLSQMLGEIVSNFVENFRREGVILSYEQMGDVSIYGDRTLLSRVFATVVRNAREAVINEGTVKIMLCHETSNVKVIIEDNGKGMTAQLQELIFKPFALVEKTKGCGLGLAMAKKFIEAHNGSINIASAVDKGTVCTILLPL